MSRYRKIILGLIQVLWNKAPKDAALLRLNKTILEMIYRKLSLVDQVCLSLSCKELFCRFGTILKHKDLEFPLLLRIRDPILCVNGRDVLRNQIFLRLENRRWAYCAKCLKLHPRREFTRRLLKQSALGRSCTCYAGIADLCPCISMTIRNRDQLVNILKSPAKPTKTKYGPFEYDFDDAGHPTLGHVCLFSTRSGYDMRVALVLFIKTGQLCIAARHTINFSSSDAHLTAEPTFACPYQDLLSLVPQDQTSKDFHRYQNVRSSKAYQDLLSLVPDKPDSEACTMCPTCITKQDLCEDMCQVAFWVVRNLGNFEWPADCHWLKQCRLTGELFLHNEQIW